MFRRKNKAEKQPERTLQEHLVGSHQNRQSPKSEHRNARFGEKNKVQN